jgi:division protein CdvB (Snf7/Vps24/ESCRT-III family)
MIESKERVMTRKQDYQQYEHIRTPKKSQPPDYEKKLKLQNKMMRIQTGKIQKISQRDSRLDCSRQQMQEIKKNLFQITHLFD